MENKIFPCEDCGKKMFKGRLKELVKGPPSNRTREFLCLPCWRNRRYGPPEAKSTAPKIGVPKVRREVKALCLRSLDPLNNEGKQIRKALRPLEKKVLAKELARKGFSNKEIGERISKLEKQVLKSNAIERQRVKGTKATDFNTAFKELRERKR